MTREELKVGQILADEKNNSYLVYKINDAKNIAYCLNNEFATARICLDDLRYFDVWDEMDMNLLISKLRGEQE